MARPLMLLTLVVLPLTGTLLGVHLGRSAIAEINPLYFQAPETRFHSDLAANRPKDWMEAPPQFTNASLIEGLGSGCIKCIDYPMEYRPIHDPSVDESSAWVGEDYAAAEGVSAVDEATGEAAEPRVEIALRAYDAVTTQPAQEQATTDDIGPAPATPPDLGSESGDESMR